MMQILSLLAGIEVLILFVTLRKMERLREIEAEIHACAFDLACALDLGRQGRYDEAVAAAERWRERTRPFRQGQRLLGAMRHGPGRSRILRRPMLLLPD